MNKLERTSANGMHESAPPHNGGHDLQKPLLSTLSERPNFVEDYFSAELAANGRLVTTKPSVITGRERARVVKQLNKYVKLMKGARKKNRDLIVNTVKRSEKLKESVRRDAETLADCMLLRKLEVLKQHSRIQMSLLRNENEIYRRTLRLVDDKLAFAEFALRELKASRVCHFDAASQEFFVDPNDILKQSKAELASARNDLRQWLTETRKIYEQVSRETLEEDQVPRDQRVRRIIESAVNFYTKDKKVALYKPCRNQEQEFEAVLFDIRHKEGQHARRWLAILQTREPETVTPGIIKSYTRKVAEGFHKDYNLPSEWTPFTHTLTCRSIYGRLRKLNVMPHGNQEPVPNPMFDDKDKELKNQITWMRTLSLQQLGIEQCFQVTGDLILEDQRFQEEQRKAQEERAEHEAAGKRESNVDVDDDNLSIFGSSATSSSPGDGDERSGAEARRRRDSYENMKLSASNRNWQRMNSAEAMGDRLAAPPTSSIGMRRTSLDSTISSNTNQPLLDDAESRRFFDGIRAVSSDAFLAPAPNSSGRSGSDNSPDAYDSDSESRGSSPGSISGFSVFSEQPSASRRGSLDSSADLPAPIVTRPPSSSSAAPPTPTPITKPPPNVSKQSARAAINALRRSQTMPRYKSTPNGVSLVAPYSREALDALSELSSLSRPPPPPPPQPYRAAIDVLEALNELIVPSDMLQCLVHCAHVIYETAREYEEINRRKDVRQSILQRKREMLASGTMSVAAVESVTSAALAAAWSASDSKDSFGAIGADLFFPIFLYVTIHARLPGLHRSLFMLEKFSSRGELLSETGYYLSTLDSAVHHIMSATPHMYSDLTRKEHRRALMDALLDLEDDDSDITAYTTASLLPSPTTRPYKNSSNGSTVKGKSGSVATMRRRKKKNDASSSSSTPKGEKRRQKRNGADAKDAESASTPKPKGDKRKQKRNSDSKTSENSSDKSGKSDTNESKEKASKESKSSKKSGRGRSTATNGAPPKKNPGEKSSPTTKSRSTVELPATKGSPSCSGGAVDDEDEDDTGMSVPLVFTQPIGVPELKHSRSSSASLMRNRSPTTQSSSLSLSSRHTPTPTSEDPLSASTSPYGRSATPLGSLLSPRNAKLESLEKSLGISPSQCTESDDITSPSSAGSKSSPSGVDEVSENPEQFLPDDNSEKAAPISTPRPLPSNRVETVSASGSSAEIFDSDANSAASSGLATLLREHRKKDAERVESPASVPGQKVSRTPSPRFKRFSKQSSTMRRPQALKSKKPPSESATSGSRRSSETKKLESS